MRSCMVLPGGSPDGRADESAFAPALVEIEDALVPAPIVEMLWRRARAKALGVSVKWGTV